MHTGNGQPAETIDLYLDGLLDPHERLAFERRLADDPALRATVAQQGRIDESIRRSVAVPPAETLSRLASDARLAANRPSLDTVRGVQEGRGRSARRVPRWLGIAAALLLTAAGGWMLWPILAPATTSPRYSHAQPFRTVQQVYDDAVAAGFEPEVECRDAEEFAAWFREAFGQGLQLEPLPQEVAALGLGYSETISPDTIYVLMQVEQQPVLVFVDRLDALGDPVEPPAPTSALFLHRRDVGDLVLLELSPFAGERVLDRFYDPDRPANTRPSSG